MVTSGAHNELDQLAAGWPARVRLSGDGVPSEAEVRRFAPAFPGIAPDRLAELDTAARLFATLNLEIDSVVDGDRAARLGALDLVAIQFEGYRLLAGLFPGTSRTWDALREAFIRYARMLDIQGQFVDGRRKLADLSREEAVGLAMAKTALATVTVTALGELTGAYDVAEKLRTSIEQLMIGKCFADDVLDWRRDAEAARPSFAVAEALRVAGFETTPARGWSAPELDRVGRALYFGGVAKSLFDFALEAISAARAAAAGLPVTKWQEYVDELERTVCRRRDQLPENSTATEPPNRQGALSIVFPSAGDRPWRALAQRSVVALLQRWRTGFSDAAHVMRFPDGIGGAREEQQVGDVFSRALLANALAEADTELGGGQLAPCVEREVRHLLARRRAEPGLWSYFPDLPDLPCDADDLAEVLRLLTRTGNTHRLRAELDLALRCAFEDGAHPDGSFDTWIISRQDPGERWARQLTASRELWGEGTDPEVVANLLHAVAEYQPDSWRDVLDRGVAYLIANQADDGSWASGWYEGRLYGTYQCLRTIAATRGPDCGPVARGAEFVLRAQHEDGGWANGEGDSDPLGTGLALLALAEDGQPSEKSRRAAMRGLTWLRSAREADGSFRGVPFIAMRTRRSPGLARPLSFASPSITTAFVCQAAMRWDRLS